MKVVKAYKAFDGTLFDDEQKCIAYDRENKRRENLKPILTNGLNDSQMYSIEDVGNFIESNADAIVKALTVSVRNYTPRTPKTAAVGV